MSEQLFKLPHVASRLFDQPLAIEQRKLHLIASVLAPRLGVTLIGLPDASLLQAKVTPKALAPTDRPFQIVNGKAVIPIMGTLVQRAGSMDAESGLVSYEWLRQTMEEADADRGVAEKLLHIDSGGGEATGLVDFLDFMRLSGERKPITAFTDGMAASAAYGIFSAASRRVNSQDALLGSVGVRMLHVDQVKRNEAMGLVVTEFFAGARKVDFSPHESLNEEKIAALQGIVDAFYDIFTASVAKNLGETQQFVKDTEAGLFVGQQAIDARLSQSIGTLDAVYRITSPAPIGARAKQQHTERRQKTMDDITTVAALEAAYSQLVGQIRKEAGEAAVSAALAPAIAEAQAAERTRIQKIMQRVPAGCEAIARECAYEKPVPASEAIERMWEHQATQGAAALQNHRDDAPAPLAPAPTTPLTSGEITPEQAKVNQQLGLSNETFMQFFHGQPVKQH